MLCRRREPARSVAVPAEPARGRSDDGRAGNFAETATEVAYPGGEARVDFEIHGPFASPRSCGEIDKGPGSQTQATGLLCTRATKIAPPKNVIAVTASNLRL
jgi:hypothetical protein